MGIRVETISKMTRIGDQEYDHFNQKSGQNGHVPNHLFWSFRTWFPLAARTLLEDNPTGITTTYGWVVVCLV